MTAPAWAPAAPVLVITGHYGVGKTNLALNLALDAAARLFLLEKGNCFFAGNG